MPAHGLPSRKLCPDDQVRLDPKLFSHVLMMALYAIMLASIPNL